MILLDTTICNYIINAKTAAVLERFGAQPPGPGDVSGPLTILPFDERAAWAYRQLRTDLERRGTPIGSLDTMIAAHALSLQVETGCRRPRCAFPPDCSCLQVSEPLLGGESTRGHGAPASVRDPQVGRQQGSIKARKASGGTVASIASKKRWRRVLFLA